MGKEEDIFSDKFDEKNIEHSEFTPPPDTGEPEKKPEKIVHDDGLGKKHPKRTAGIIGAVTIGVIIIMAYFLFVEYVGGEPLDPAECMFGIYSEIFFDRCVTLIEFEANEKAKQEILERQLQREQENDKEVTRSDGTPFKDIAGATDKVEVTKTNEPIGYYLITTTDDWYGDFVDIRKVPSKIEKSGSLKVNFRCFTDEFQGTSTYFGTFRNVIDANLTVEVYINGIEVESQSTTVNKALILEGSCYGHES